MNLKVFTVTLVLASLSSFSSPLWADCLGGGGAGGTDCGGVGSSGGIPTPKIDCSVLEEAIAAGQFNKTCRVPYCDQKTIEVKYNDVPDGTPSGLDDGNPCTNDICVHGSAVNQPITTDPQILADDKCQQSWCQAGVKKTEPVKDSDPTQDDECHDRVCEKATGWKTVNLITQPKFLADDKCQQSWCQAGVKKIELVEDPDPGKNDECNDRACSKALGWETVKLSDIVLSDSICTQLICQGGKKVTTSKQDHDLGLKPGDQCTNLSCKLGEVVEKKVEDPHPEKDDECNDRVCSKALGWETVKLNKDLGFAAGDQCTKLVCESGTKVSKAMLPEDDKDVCTIDRCNPVDGTTKHEIDDKNPACVPCTPVTCDSPSVVNNSNVAVFHCEINFANPLNEIEKAQYFIDCDGDGVFEKAFDVDGIGGDCHLPELGKYPLQETITVRAALKNQPKEDSGFCTDDVLITAACSDQIVQGPEECDGGADCDGGCKKIPSLAEAPPPPAPPSPPVQPYCGDGVTQEGLGEECDGGIDCDQNCKKVEKTEDGFCTGIDCLLSKIPVADDTTDDETTEETPTETQPEESPPPSQTTTTITEEVPPPVQIGTKEGQFAQPQTTTVKLAGVQMAFCPEGWPEAIVSSGPNFGKRIPLEEGTTCPFYPDEELKRGINNLPKSIQGMIRPMGEFVNDSDNRELLHQLNLLSIDAIEDYLKEKPVPVAGLALTGQSSGAARLVAEKEMPPKALLAALFLNDQGEIGVSQDGSIEVPPFDPAPLLDFVAGMSKGNSSQALTSQEWDASAWEEKFVAGGGTLSPTYPADYQIVSVPVLRVQGGGSGCTLIPSF